MGIELTKAISLRIRWAIYRRDNFACRLCGELVNFRDYCNNIDGPTLDHIIPRSLGGSDEIENLRLACRMCNSKRGNGQRTGGWNSRKTEL